MSKVFEDKKCTELLLRIILNRDDLIVDHVNCQQDIKNLQGRSIRMDILAHDRKGVIYNIEVQNDDAGADPKRARYNSSLLDANITEAGDKYDQLRETYVIFITKNDVLGSGLPIYHIDRAIKETGEKFEDESHIIYVNSSIQDETKLGKLMQDFWCKRGEEMNYEVLAERVSFFKEKKEGVNQMCEILDEVKRESKLETLVDLVKDGAIPLDIAAKKANMSEEEFKKYL
ncbi:PD-(D/E)XK nuclease family transposase [Anaerostipes hadrus]|uniref:PD-(D/E)XK nuclease family transposase n=1 Tax=Anaerostipes hadrus TaxID=649756 RepID=UPI001FC88056|nr:PD-(D/E)XK nuclease family transposase [Anaerostipes hadrus]